MGKHEDNELAVKFKNREKEFRSKISKGSFVGIRLDGKAFHTFTKQFERPYDLKFMDAMDETAKFIIEKTLNTARFAYVQSDEISIFFDDVMTTSELPNAGKVEKLISTSASAATGGFMISMPEAEGAPIFDSRVFLLDGLDEIEEYVNWRRFDARKNSISMASEIFFSERELNGVTTKERHAKLEGTHLENLPDGFFNGRLITREAYNDKVSFVHGKTGELNTVDAVRNRWVSNPATREAVESLMENMNEMLLQESA